MKIVKQYKQTQESISTLIEAMKIAESELINVNKLEKGDFLKIREQIQQLQNILMHNFTHYLGWEEKPHQLLDICKMMDEKLTKTNQWLDFDEVLKSCPNAREYWDEEGGKVLALYKRYEDSHWVEILTEIISQESDLPKDFIKFICKEKLEESLDFDKVLKYCPKARQYWEEKRNIILTLYKTSPDWISILAENISQEIDLPMDFLKSICKEKLEEN